MLVKPAVVPGFYDARVLCPAVSITLPCEGLRSFGLSRHGNVRSLCGLVSCSPVLVQRELEFHLN